MKINLAKGVKGIWLAPESKWAALHVTHLILSVIWKALSPEQAWQQPRQKTGCRWMLRIDKGKFLLSLSFFFFGSAIQKQPHNILVPLVLLSK